jgi:hypothetical protein
MGEPKLLRLLVGDVAIDSVNHDVERNNREIHTFRKTVVEFFHVKL